MDRGFLITGHRGASAFFPENTIKSIQAAIECGATAVELDVRSTLDGHLVLSHDPTLERTCGLSKQISEIRLSEVQSLRAGGERIPTLEEAVGAVAGRLNLDLDIKLAGFEEQIVNIVREYDHFGNTLFTSFFPQVVYRVNQIAPEAKKGLITMGTTEEAVLICSEVGASTIVPFCGDLDDKLLKMAKSSGLSIIPWTVNEPEEARRLIEKGVDGIITDDPCGLSKAISGSGDRPPKRKTSRRS